MPITPQAGKTSPSEVSQLAAAIQELGVPWNNPLWKNISVDIRSALHGRSCSPIIAANSHSSHSVQRKPSDWRPPLATAANPLRTPSLGCASQYTGGFTSVPSGDVTASPFAMATPVLDVAPSTGRGSSPATSLPHALSQQDPRTTVCACLMSS